MADNCLRCGRALKSKESIKRGYGSYCYKKVNSEKKRDYEIEESKEVIPEIKGQINIVDEMRKCS